MRVVLGVNPAITVDSGRSLNELLEQSLGPQNMEVTRGQLFTGVYDLACNQRDAWVVISDLYPVTETSSSKNAIVRHIRDAAYQQVEQLPTLALRKEFKNLLAFYGSPPEQYGGLWLIVAIGSRVIPLTDPGFIGRTERSHIIKHFTGREPIPLVSSGDELMDMIEWGIRKAAYERRNAPSARTPDRLV